MTECSVQDCDKQPTRRGMCNKHYLRWWRYGDPQGGSTPRGDAIKFYNDVVLTYVGNDCLTWPFGRSSCGYGQVHLDGRMYTVSRLACEEENGPPASPDLEAAHSCGNGHLACVSRKHLRWATRAENRDDMVQHGRSNRGSKNPLVKLTEHEVRLIKSLKDTVPSRELASQFGVTQRAIAAIYMGRSWSWLE